MGPHHFRHYFLGRILLIKVSRQRVALQYHVSHIIAMLSKNNDWCDSRGATFRLVNMRLGGLNHAFWGNIVQIRTYFEYRASLGRHHTGTGFPLKSRSQASVFLLENPVYRCRSDVNRNTKHKQKLVQNNDF